MRALLLEKVAVLFIMENKMSIWTEVTGTISHHVRDHFSIKKFIGQEWDGSEYVIESYYNKQRSTFDVVYENVRLVWTSDGISAAKELDCIMEKILNEYKTVRFDLEAHIRFF